MLRRVSVFLAMVLLTGCGAVYQSPRVTPGPQVEVVDLTVATVARANQSPYQPRALPPIFGVTAGTGTPSRGAGALPDVSLPLPATLPNTQIRIPANADPGPYRIGVGYVVQLATPAPVTPIGDAGQMATFNATVQDDGAVTIPNVGRITLAELTLQQAEAALFQRFAESQQAPTFGLEIAEFNARKISVGGAVATPAIVPVTLTPLYLNEALAQVGGVTSPEGNGGVLRLYRDGALYQIPLAQYRARADLQRLRLKDGDSIHVDEGLDLDRAQAYFEQQIALTQVRTESREAAILELSTAVSLRRNELTEARETFRTRAEFGAIPRDYVYLLGEITQQLRYALPFEERASLADALFDAGAGVPVITGDVSQVYVLRRNGRGAVTAWRLDGRDAVNFTLAPKLELRPDDIIFVAEQPITRWGRVLSQLTSGAANTSFTRSLD